MRLHQVLPGQLVEPCRQALAQPAVVHEQNRGAVRADLLEELRIHRLHEARGLGGLALAQLAQDRAAFGGRLHVHDRDADLEVEPGFVGGVHDLDRTGAAQIAGHLVHGPDGGREPHPLGVLVTERGQALQRDRQVNPALGACHGVDLVHDDGFNRAQRLARLRGQQQEQALGSGHQDLGRLLALRRPQALRRIPRADVHAWQAGLQAQSLGRPRHADQGRLQVALDVVDQRLQGRQVEHAYAGSLDGILDEAVDAGQEGSQGLTRAGGGQQQGVLAAGDQGPASLLNRGGLGEVLLEPAQRGRSKGKSL